MNHPSLIWFAIGVVCFISELLLPSFGMLFGGIAGILTAFVAFLYPGWEVQTAFFAVSVVASLVFLRPLALRKWQAEGAMPTRAEALVGQAGRVTEKVGVDGEMGRVLIDGQDWAAKAAGASRTIDVGVRVQVVAVDGIVLHVEPKENV